MRSDAQPMTTSSPIARRQRGALRLAALLAAGIGTLAWLGRSADPAAKQLPSGPLTLGAAVPCVCKWKTAPPMNPAPSPPSTC